jgi:CheY-like chemotaxis protein
MKTCLLIENDPEDQEFFIDTLHRISSKAGCYAVPNCEEALFTLTQEYIEPDYIFIEWSTPGMSGPDFLKILKGIEKFGGIPVIVFSSDYSEDQMQRLKSLGATAVYSKTRFGILGDILAKYFAG